MAPSKFGAVLLHCKTVQHCFFDGTTNTEADPFSA